ncbi:ABC transporter substrate-binding protein [Geoalkalibacter halelectricus]|uniref:Helical backbone metal receptor n=1 Tax=Geoalkalibacter halelectricus TaxID=2847045 RepID=A0ABY5ZN33_9BACT|nr:helical backbone metal receptor [Geoalkalibacter halelectricus]MDO3376835.1 helical backbone metal receptor [Geoalkalibacter halelectricus]UWZ79099.1 helical backbone metal receptor [Geoalkalibacter halelectricus]
MTDKTGRKHRRYDPGVLRTACLCAAFVLFGAQLQAATPQRIVSLAPAMTEILFALDLGEQVVGVTSFCDRPQKALSRTRVGGMSNPSLEAILALKPDLVVLSMDGNPREVAQRLERLGVKIHVFTARRMEDIPQGIRDLGKDLQAPTAAERLAQNLEKTILRHAQVAETVPAADRKRALFVIWPEPLIVAGTDTLVDDALTLLGFDNIAAGTGVSYPRFSVEEVLRRKPEVIIFGQGQGAMATLAEGLMQRLGSLGAIQEDRLIFVDDALYRAGPRIAEGIADLSHALNERREHAPP